MTTFSVWAPAPARAEVEVAGQRYPMDRDASGSCPGWWSAHVPDVAAGIDYGFRLDDGELLPDPRSLRQPFGIKGRAAPTTTRRSAGRTGAGAAGRCTGR